MAPDPKSPPRSLNDTLPFITVMMPAFNEEAYIRESLLSLISTGYPLDRMEVIVADGQSTDHTREEVAKVSAQYPFVRVIDNPRRLQSAGCNLAAAQADPRSEYYIRVDAHSKWSERFLPLCIETAKKTGAALVVFVNAPVGITPFQKALAYALQHPLGVGNSLYRLGKHSGWVDHGQHGCFTKDIWKKTQGYSLVTGLRANEDVEFSYRVQRMNGRIWLSSHLRMSYFPRKNITALIIQYYNYGIGRLTNHWLHQSWPSLRQIIPPLFLIITILFIILAFLISAKPLFLLASSYFAIIIFCSFYACLKHKTTAYLFLLIVFPTIHYAWAGGFLYALLQNLTPISFINRKA